MADRRPVTWPDLGLTALLVAFTLLGTAGAAANQGQTATLPSYVLAVAACLPIALWRWQPSWTFAGTGAVTVTYLALGYAYGPIMITLAVAVYGFAVRSSIRHVVGGMAALLLAGFVVIGVGVATGDREWTEFVSVAAWLVVPAAVGVVVKVRRDARSEVRAEQARRAISEERLQLAQEVHDVAGHGFAVIAMQAGVALRVLDRDPAGARSALEVIRATQQGGARRPSVRDRGASPRLGGGAAETGEGPGRSHEAHRPHPVEWTPARGRRGGQCRRS